MSRNRPDIAEMIELLPLPQERPEAEQLYRQILNELSEAIVALDDEREIVFANEAFLAMVHVWSQGKVLGKRVGEALGCWRLVDGHRCGETEFCRECGGVSAFHEALQKGHAEDEYRIINAVTGDAVEKRVRVSAVTVDGRPMMLLVFEDITDEKRRQVLERVFLHDIANTLSSLVMAAQVTRTRGGEERLGTLDAIIRRLVEEVRAHKTLTQAERGELSPRFERILLAEVFTRIETLNDHLTRSRSVSLAFELDSPEATLETDPTLLGRVLDNLVRNAVEASEPSSRVTVGAVLDEDAVELWVHNPGVIPFEVQAQIFQRSFSTKGRGRGVGSYSVKLLAERYLGGEVGFASSEETGTRFFARLPRHQRSRGSRVD